MLYKVNLFFVAHFSNLEGADRGRNQSLKAVPFHDFIRVFSICIKTHIFSGFPDVLSLFQVFQVQCESGGKSRKVLVNKRNVDMKAIFIITPVSVREGRKKLPASVANQLKHKAFS